MTTRKINTVLSQAAADALERLAKDFNGNKTAVLNSVLLEAAKGRQIMQDPEATYYRSGNMKPIDILAAAGVDPADITNSTFLYISSETGEWTSIEKPDEHSNPADDFGRGGFYARRAGLKAN